MSKFYVGQAVRVSCSGSIFNNHETVILSLNAKGWSGHDYFGYEVDIPMRGHGYGPEYADNAVFEPHELIPIQRRGDKLTAYDTTATDEATKAMLKAMSEKGVAA